MTTGHATYYNSSSYWLGDEELRTDWTKSISLTEAYGIYAKGGYSSFTGFVWRAMIEPCVTQPSFFFKTSNSTDEYHGRFNQT